MFDNWITDPNTFEATSFGIGYWIVLDENEEAIGVMRGKVIVTSEMVQKNTNLVHYEKGHYLKPVTKTEFETAKAFGFTTEYDAEALPDLELKFPEEILDNKDLI